MKKVLLNDVIIPHQVNFPALLSGIEATAFQVSTSDTDTAGFY